MEKVNQIFRNDRLKFNFLPERSIGRLRWKCVCTCKHVLEYVEAHILIFCTRAHVPLWILVGVKFLEKERRFFCECDCMWIHKLKIPSQLHSAPNTYLLIEITSYEFMRKKMTQNFFIRHLWIIQSFRVLL